MRLIPSALVAAAAVLLAGCGTIADAATGKQEYFGKAVADMESWESAPTQVDARGRNLDKPAWQGVGADDTFEVRCALSVAGTTYLLTEQSEPEGWSERKWEAWIYADDVRLKPSGSDEALQEAGVVPDDIKQCDVAEPEVYAAPPAPDAHHAAYLVTYEETLYLEVADTIFNGMGRGFVGTAVQGPVELDVHCVRTTMNIVEEPPSTSYSEEVPYYLVTYDDATWYVDPLWIYFTDDPDAVPTTLDYDPNTGTVADHGDVPDLAECP